MSANPKGEAAQAALGQLAAELAAPRFRSEVRRWRDEERRELARLVVSQTETGGSADASPEGGASSLDHLGISDPSRENPTHCDPGLELLPTDPPRACFLPPGHELADVERLTEGHRRGKASRHRAAAARAARGIRDDGAPFEPPAVDALAPNRTPEEREAWPPARREAVILPRRTAAVGRTLDERQELRAASERSARWHRGRARGALERFDRVDNCGRRAVRVSCNNCGGKHEVPDRCGCDRLCHACRAASRARRVPRMAEAQIRQLTAARRRGLLNRYRHGGAWGEKLLTLTIPHFDRVLDPAPDLERLDVTVQARIDAIFRAWRRFALKLNAWSRRQIRRHRGTRPAFYRSFEWTPGDDGKGHPHFHVWILAPWIPFSREHDGKDGIRDWWRAALAAEGVPDADIALCDVRAAHARNLRDNGIRAEVMKGAITVENAAGQAVQRYIEGWSIADAASSPADVRAALYEALDGRRLVATSPHLLAKRPEGCADCGAKGWTRTEIVDRPSSEPCRTLQGPARSPP